MFISTDVLWQVPPLVQDRVKLWMQYTWEHQKSFDENIILSFLPAKMRTDLALQVVIQCDNSNNFYNDAMRSRFTTRLSPR